MTMPGALEDGPARQTADAPSVATSLAYERTRLAMERTLMAWIRTALSLISFGFTLNRFFQYLHDTAGPRGLQQMLGPREVGLLMIGIGIIALILATWQHAHNMRVLRRHDPSAPLSVAAVLAGMVSVLGIVALIASVVLQ